MITRNICVKKLRLKFDCDQLRPCGEVAGFYLAESPVQLTWLVFAKLVEASHLRLPEIRAAVGTACGLGSGPSARFEACPKPTVSKRVPRRNLRRSLS